MWGQPGTHNISKTKQNTKLKSPVFCTKYESIFLSFLLFWDRVWLCFGCQVTHYMDQEAGLKLTVIHPPARIKGTDPYGRLGFSYHKYTSKTVSKSTDTDSKWKLYICLDPLRSVGIINTKETAENIQKGHNDPRGGRVFCPQYPKYLPNEPAFSTQNQTSSNEQQK